VQEKAGNTLELIGIAHDFLYRTQIAWQLRERIDKWDYMKLKSFSTTKEMLTRLERQHTEWEKIFAVYISDKGLITKVTQKTKLPLKINDPVKKWANKLHIAFSKEEIQMAKNHMKKCSIS
jgi:hypothetical protein